MKKIYRFFWDCRRMGELDGLFIADDKDVEDVIQEKQELPAQIEAVMGKKKTSIKINTYSGLKNFLLSYNSSKYY